MAALTLRVLTRPGDTTKATPLSNAEIDTNFINLDADLDTKAPIASPTFTGTASFDSTTAVKLPVGTEGEKPSGVAGDVRFNSTNITFEGYTGSAWQNFGDVTLTGSQTLTNKTLTSPTINDGTTNLDGGTLILPQTTVPAQTAEGSVVWDTDNDLLTIGTGSARKTLVDTDSTQTLTNKTISTGSTWSGNAIGLSSGGTGASLADPDADRILFWDDSAGAVTWLTLGSNLTITGTTIDASGGVSGTVALANGGTGSALVDPNADRILFWDDSAGATTWLAPGTGISISGTTLVTDVTLTGTQTLTNKTLTSPTITGAVLNDGYTEEVFAVSGTAPALSPANGSIQTWTLTGNSTPTAGTWNAGQSITLMIDDGSAYTITWTSLAVTWKTNAGTAPTLNTTGYTVISLWKVGTTIYGARVGDA